MPVELICQFTEDAEPLVQPVQQKDSSTQNTIEYGCLRKARPTQAATQFPALSPVFVLRDQTKLLLRFKQFNGVGAVIFVS